MTLTTPSPISPVKEFEALCDLIPEDAYWGMPLTPDLVRHIRDCSTAQTTGSAPEPSACPSCGGSQHTWKCTCDPIWPEYVARDAAPNDAISDVLAERERQDAQWGGQDHDDQHTKADWQNYIYRQHYAASSFCGTPEQYRVRLVKIAALAVAAIESIDRIAAIAPREET